MFDHLTQAMDLLAEHAELKVQASYGVDNSEQRKGHRQITIAAIMAALCTEDRQLGETQFRVWVAKAMEARTCQCGGTCTHSDQGVARTTPTACIAYYEADVPEVNGLKLCGWCYPRV